MSETNFKGKRGQAVLLKEVKQKTCPSKCEVEEPKYKKLFSYSQRVKKKSIADSINTCGSL